MQDKIQDILKNENITQAKLAEILGIQASAISHLLSGRNKASMDVVQKILKAFPSINPDWLILGEGEMYRNSSEPPKNQNISIKSVKNEPFMGTLFDDISSNEPEYPTQKELNHQPPKQETKNNNKFESNDYGQQNNSHYKQPQQMEERELVSKPTETAQPFPVDSNNYHQPQPRTIKRIIILYSDGSFEELTK